MMFYFSINNIIHERLLSPTGHVWLRGWGLGRKWVLFQYCGRGTGMKLPLQASETIEAIVLLSVDSLEACLRPRISLSCCSKRSSWRPILKRAMSYRAWDGTCSRLQRRDSDCWTKPPACSMRQRMSKRKSSWLCVQRIYLGCRAAIYLAIDYKD